MFIISLQLFTLRRYGGVPYCLKRLTKRSLYWMFAKRAGVNNPCRSAKFSHRKGLYPSISVNMLQCNLGG